MASTEQPAKQRWSARKWLLVTAGTLVAALVLAVLIGLGTSQKIGNAGMRPALRPGDRVLVDTSAYHKHGPGRFDVVALHPPRGGLTVLRVIGLPGDRLRIDPSAGTLVQPGGRGPWYLVHAQHPVDRGEAGVDPVTVPAGKYFVLGDNPAAATDSRQFGLVDRSAITGRVSFRVWPPGGVGGRPQLVPLR